MAITKSFSLADITYASTISNVEGYNQYIQQLVLTFFPLGNTKFSFGNIAYYHWEKKSGGTFAMNPYVSFKPTNSLTIQGLYFSNQTMNLVERNGYFVNNSPDLTTSRLTGVVDLALNRHFSVYGLYMYENKKMTSGVVYSYSSFILGLKIIF